MKNNFQFAMLNFQCSSTQTARNRRTHDYVQGVESLEH